MDNMIFDALSGWEKLQLKLRSLYMKNGYKRYLVSKFEEYDLYANNKDFLLSNRVITFTDTDGKLMALKPDVTLSVIKNNKDSLDKSLKIFYDENVFRISKDSFNFKEINQTGLEYLGQIDDYRIFEVMSLAVESLNEISNSFALNVSDLDVVSAVLDSAMLFGSDRSEMLELIRAKNTHGIEEFCFSRALDKEKTELFKLLSSVRGDVEKNKEKLKKLAVNKQAEKSIESLISIVRLLSEKYGKGKINVDFSLISDTNYYNGITFNGVIEGIPSTVLSGGRYDKLMARLNKKSGAIGFAVYSDLLSKLFDSDEKVGQNVTIIYDDESDIKKVIAKAEELKKQGKAVSVEKYSKTIDTAEVLDLR